MKPFVVDESGWAASLTALVILTVATALRRFRFPLLQLRAHDFPRVFQFPALSLAGVIRAHRNVSRSNDLMAVASSHDFRIRQKIAKVRPESSRWRSAP